MSSAKRRTLEGISDCSECLFTNPYHSISSDEELLCSALKELVNLAFCVPQVKVRANYTYFTINLIEHTVYSGITECNSVRGRPSPIVSDVLANTHYT